MLQRVELVFVLIVCLLFAHLTMEKNINLNDYYRVEGTLMFRADKISGRELSDYMKQVKEQIPELVYYGIRTIDSAQKLHMDILILVEKSKYRGEVSQMKDLYIDDKLLDGLYKKHGNVLKGHDINYADIYSLYLNNKFFKN